MKSTFKKWAFPLAVILGFLAASAKATPYSSGHPLGLGLIGGTPTGLTLKYWINNTNAFDVAVGSFGHYYGVPYWGVNVHADYLWHRYGIFGNSSDEAYNHMPLYFGVGGVFSGPGVVGARGVFGVTWLFNKPFDVFLEIAPILVVAPYVGFGPSAGLGGRFYF